MSILQALRIRISYRFLHTITVFASILHSLHGFSIPKENNKYEIDEPIPPIPPDMPKVPVDNGVNLNLEDFGLKVKENLDQASWLARRDILRTLVKRIEIGKTHITIVFRVGPSPGVVSPRMDVLQDCRPRVHAHAG